MSAKDIMEGKLKLREHENTLRQLHAATGLIDFSSNDYLGFSRSSTLKQLIKEEIFSGGLTPLGATGSRLLTGNSAYAEQLEKEISSYHQAANGLIFNSGYAANTALFSCLPQKGDTIITDEYIHASVIDGSRLSFARRLKFRHNDLEDLENKLRRKTGTCYVAVESIYSMDGDLADLAGISQLCAQYEAHLIVDEAHAFGVLGTGLVDELKLHHLIFARVVTFGKALGLHGAIVIGSTLLRDYLVNFARPFIYSTATPLSHLISLKVAYQYLLSEPSFQTCLAAKSLLFTENAPKDLLRCTRNPTPVQGVFVNDNIQALEFSHYLRKQGFDVRPILSPSVPRGKERLRICLHTHNTDQQILDLCKLLHHIN